MSDKVSLKVTGMSCMHCVGRVKNALSRQPGVAAVNVDLAAGRAEVTGKNLDPKALVEVVKGQGYGAEVGAA